MEILREVLGITKESYQDDDTGSTKRESRLNKAHAWSQQKMDSALGNAHSCEKKLSDNCLCEIVAKVVVFVSRELIAHAAAAQSGFKYMNYVRGYIRIAVDLIILCLLGVCVWLLIYGVLFCTASPLPYSRIQHHHFSENRRCVRAGDQGILFD